nr:hypothetical protein [Tanacetum cinerariifolium]
MRNLKFNDEACISSLPDAELFESLQLMGYNILPNQKFTFQKGQFSHQWKYPIHTIMQCLSPKTPRVTSFAADEGSMQQKLDELTALCTSLQRQQSEMVSRFEAQELEINSLKARIKLLEDKDKGVTDESRDDASIKRRRRLDEGDEAAERVSDDTEEMAIVLTSMDAASIITSGGVQVVPTAAEVATATVSIPTGSGVVSTASHIIPTAALIFTTAIESTPYTRRKGKEKMVESDTPKKKKLQEQLDVQVARELEEQMVREDQRMSEQIARDAEVARIHAEEELQMMINSLDRSNETTLQRKPRSKKQKKDYYMAVIKGHSSWKTKDFKGMSFKQIEAKFNTVWKQIEDFIPTGSKEEAERLKRKGLRLEQGCAKKLKTSEEVPEKVKSSEEVPEEKVKEMMQLVPIEEVYVEALQVKHPIIDWKVHTEGQRSYWKITRLGGSSASIRPAGSDKEMELWVKLKRLYEPDVKDQLWTHTQNLMHASVEWKLWSIKFRGGLLGIKCTRHSYCQLWSSHCQKKFPLPVKKVLTARRKEMPLLRRLHCC